MLDRPELLLVIAVLLLLFGCVAPFLMVIHVWPSTFLLNFLSYTASVAGLFIGVIGVAQQRLRAKKKDEEDEYYE